MSSLIQGAMFTALVIRVGAQNADTITPLLSAQIQTNPAFYMNAPVVLDLKDALALRSEEDIRRLAAAVRAQGLVPIAVQNAAKPQAEAALRAGLPNIAGGAAPRAVEAPAVPAASGRAATSRATPTRIVTQPVRSGTQVYAQGGDLIVTAAVSPGAEVIADGNIHIYGSLRGRAVAGANGNTEARIFCHSLEAELICVAGHYMVSDSIGGDFHRQSVQVFLSGDQLLIERNPPRGGAD